MLASWAEEGVSLGNFQLLNRFAAFWAWLSGFSIHLQFLGKIPRLTIGLGKIFQCRATLLNRRLQGLLDVTHQALPFLGAE